jgi:alanine dehydrogenase
MPSPTPLDTLLLTHRDIEGLLDFQACIDAVQEAFRAHGNGTVPPPAVLGIPVEGGGFHIKAGTLHLERDYFAVKTNANFPANPARHGLPTIQGLILLSDAERGVPLAILDSREITRVRTAAATAVAARFLARSDAATVTICGCGIQGEAQLRALALVMRVRHVFAVDADLATGARFAHDMSAQLGIPVERTTPLGRAARASDIVVTCTPSHAPVLHSGDVGPGTFVAAVGADNPEKHEIEPRLMADATIVTDVTSQAAAMGDLHHAISAGIVSLDAVHAELGEIVAGRKAGRSSDAEIIVFDSTGMALQDVAAAAVVYRRALNTGAGQRVRLGT